MTKQHSKSTPEPKPRLFVGTTEQIAKEAPLRGLEPPVVLSDVYPGYFAFFSSQSDKQRWGIVEVNLEALLPDNFAPFHGYIEKLTRKGSTEDVFNRRASCLKEILNYKNKWKDSLKKCGVCLYLLHIPPLAITKVTTYSPFGTGSNQFVNKCVAESDPWEISTAHHQSTYTLNAGLTRWLACETVSGAEMLNGDGTARKSTKLDEFLQNRNSLELFYRRTEKDFHSWWKA